MDIALYIGMLVLGSAFLITGFVGSILPVLPGPPISYLSLLTLHFANIYKFSPWLLASLAIVTIAILALDYIIPMYGTKKTGGSNYGVWGTAIGLILGIFFIGATAGLSIIVGPFLGAFIGELISGKKSNEAFKAAVGAFLGFLAGTFSKIMLCVVISGVFIYGAIKGGVGIF